MALDRAVQLACDAGEARPTLRLYTWTRPTVTLGRFQDAGGVDAGWCTTEGIAVVRRFTGGRGVLHDDELTYSIVAGTGDGVPRGTAASYRYLCVALVEAYRELGIDAALTGRQRGDGSSAACYLHATQADLSLGARKLSGSAQVWHGSTVLQHGSFTVSRNVAREARVFGLDALSALRLGEETTTLMDQLGYAPSVAELAAAVTTGMQRGLGIALEPGTLTELELTSARALLAETAPDRPLRRHSVRTSS